MFYWSLSILNKALIYGCYCHKYEYEWTDLLFSPVLKWHGAFIVIYQSLNGIFSTKKGMTTLRKGKTLFKKGMVSHHADYAKGEGKYWVFTQMICLSSINYNVYSYLCCVQVMHYHKDLEVIHSVLIEEDFVSPKPSAK